MYVRVRQLCRSLSRDRTGRRYNFFCSSTEFEHDTTQSSRTGKWALICAGQWTQYIGTEYSKRIWKLFYFVGIAVSPSSKMSLFLTCYCPLPQSDHCLQYQCPHEGSSIYFIGCTGIMSIFLIF